MKKFTFLKEVIVTSLLMFAITCVGSANALVISPLSDLTGNPAHTETDTGDQVFRLTDTSGVLDDATVFLLFESAGFGDSNSLGIYGVSNDLEVFSGTNSAVTSSTLSWDTSSNTVTNLSTGLSAIIDDQLFGFYLDSGDGNRYFSVSEQNGGLDMMAVYNVGSAGHPDLFGSNLIFGWEDISVGSDWDYNDMVVGVSDISSAGVPTLYNVPEPMPLALMGLGLIGLAGVKRRK